MFLSNFGIQIETVSLRGATSYKSIPINNIESLLINEVSCTVYFNFILGVSCSRNYLLFINNIKGFQGHNSTI